MRSAVTGGSCRRRIISYSLAGDRVAVPYECGLRCIDSIDEVRKLKSLDAEAGELRRVRGIRRRHHHFPGHHSF